MRKVLIAFVLLSAALFMPKSAHAVRYQLVPPTGALTTGQTVQFTVTVDTQGSSLTGSQIGLTYESQYLQYVNAVPGNALTALNVDQASTGQILFSGSNPAGFTGTGNYAVVTFKIIATAAGSTTLCDIFVPSPTPAPAAPLVTPTVLPVTGSTETAGWSAAAGVLAILIGYGIYRYGQRARYINNRR